MFKCETRLPMTTLAEMAETAAVLMAVMTSPSMTCRLLMNECEFEQVFIHLFACRLNHACISCTYSLDIPILWVQQQHCGLSGWQGWTILPLVETHQLWAQDSIILHVCRHHSQEPANKVSSRNDIVTVFSSDHTWSHIAAGPTRYVSAGARWYAQAGSLPRCPVWRISPRRPPDVGSAPCNATAASLHAPIW